MKNITDLSKFFIFRKEIYYTNKKRLFRKKQSLVRETGLEPVR